MAVSPRFQDLQRIAHAPGVRLHHGTAMVAAAIVLMLIFNSANLPSPLYVIYRDRFHFSEIMLTLIFAVYVIGSFAALTFFGRLSDQVGRRPVLFAAIAFSALSMVLFLLTFGTPLLFVARAVSGFANGLTATACTAWIAELAPKGTRGMAAPLTSGANVVALGLGPLIAGALAQFAPAPLSLPYVVYLVGLIPPALIVWTIHETVRSKQPLRAVSFAPRIGVPRGVLDQFIAPAVTAFVAFALMGFYSSLIPNVLERSLHVGSHLVGGAVIFFMFGCGTLGLAILRGMSSRFMMFAALALLVPGVALLVVAERAASMPLLLLASGIGGVSGALGYCGSLEVVNEIAPQDRRAETVSVLLIACYAGISVPVIGTGILSQLVNPQMADLTFAIVLCVLACGAAAMGWAYGGKRTAASS
jgi:MFS family permease